MACILFFMSFNILSVAWRSYLIIVWYPFSSVNVSGFFLIAVTRFKEGSVCFGLKFKKK